MKGILILFALLLATFARAQGPGVPVYNDDEGEHPLAGIRKQAKALKNAGGLLAAATLHEQCSRTECKLTLPPPNQMKLSTRELWDRARRAHLRVGWYYLCKDCNKWHVDLSGAYAITNDTVATCAHVTGDGTDDFMREGYMIAVDEDDHVYPVVELLAINRATDSAVLRLKTDQLKPLPLAFDAAPGDAVFCFSDPMDRRGVFSNGIIERFMKRRFLRKEELSSDQKKNPAAVASPVWAQVSTAWAPGSSGSAVLDERGNAIGHVSEVQTMLDEGDEPASAEPDDKKPKEEEKPKTEEEIPGTVIVFHDAITARHVRELIKP